MHLKLIGAALKSKTGRKFIIIGLGSALLLLITVMIIPVIVITGIIEPINTAVQSIQSSTENFFNKFDHFLKGEGWSTDEEAFIRTFQSKTNYYRNRGVTINGALIMSTLMTKQLYIGEDPAEQDLGEDYENFDETRADVMSIPYGNMIGDMRKLVEHQVNKVFSIPSDADPSVYETIANPPFAVLNAAANLINTTIDSLPLGNISASNANYLAYLRFGTYASQEQLDAEKASNTGTNSVGTGNVRLTNFIDEQVGWDAMSAYGNKSERFRLNEKGWWMYQDPDTGIEYLAVAAPTTYLLGPGYNYPPMDGITYYEYGDVIPLNINGESYQAMVIDSCGACMETNDPLKIDVYVNRDYFGENGLTEAGIEAGAVLPDSLPTTFGSAPMSTISNDFWSYKEPTDEERTRANEYKNGYIYNAYRDAFKDSNGNDLEGEALVQKAERIIKTIYDMQDSYSEYNGSYGDDTPIESRTTRPNRTNTFYYDPVTGYGVNGTLEGECAWYATGRAAEFLASINSTETWTDNPNGGEFCDSVDAQKFNQGTEPKAGSLISWGYEPWGHVAFVEKVNPDGTFDISEAGISFGLYGRSARSIVSGNNAARRENCEGNGTGCFNYQSNITTSAYSNFRCFIYLREPKNGGNQ